MAEHGGVCESPEWSFPERPVEFPQLCRQDSFYEDTVEFVGRRFCRFRTAADNFGIDAVIVTQAEMGTVGAQSGTRIFGLVFARDE
jgi:hypothetical protein